jgi:hypothetical protein
MLLMPMLLPRSLPWQPPYASERACVAWRLIVDLKLYFESYELG